MFKNNLELLYSYSDDFIFFEEMREAYLTHPLKRGKTVKKWFDSYYTRLFSINLVASVEFLIDTWCEEVDISELKSLIKSGTVQEIELKTKKMEDVFKQFSISVDSEV
ncbi:hypothetical protein [Bacillus thuringiensis]|uniref:hypothetical protein n=1 Tax=Bacillus thuringiensis TaxID=1428 RepID=UPI000BEDE4CD|nr:hypothetical protein [Bacillus thuringiensis]PEE69010.1 hypothetical protein COM73_21035 [Bacillus thuringiensis]